MVLDVVVSVHVMSCSSWVVGIRYSKIQDHDYLIILFEKL